MIAAGIIILLLFIARVAADLSGRWPASEKIKQRWSQLAIVGAVLILVVAVRWIGRAW